MKNEQGFKMRTRLRLIAYAFSGLLSGSAVATPEKMISLDVFKNPHASSFEKFDSEEKENMQLAVLCFLSGERTSGMNKICYYDCLGSQAAITISSVQLCPLNINR